MHCKLLTTLQPETRHKYMCTYILYTHQTTTLHHLSVVVTLLFIPVVRGEATTDTGRRFLFSLLLRPVSLPPPPTVTSLPPPIPRPHSPLTSHSHQISLHAVLSSQCSFRLRLLVVTPPPPIRSHIQISHRIWVTAGGTIHPGFTDFSPLTGSSVRRLPRTL